MRDAYHGCLNLIIPALGASRCLYFDLSQVSPCRARYFSLATKEKYPKERWLQGLPAKAGSLRFS